jgi:hypothetical protein
VDPARARYDAGKGRIVPAGDGLPQPAEYPVDGDGDSPPQDDRPKPDFHVFHPVNCAENDTVPGIDCMLESLALTREAGGLPPKDFLPGAIALRQGAARGGSSTSGFRDS